MYDAPIEESTPAISLRPLCVDLDGTLVKSDTLIDSLLHLARTLPLTVLKVPVWLMRGKATLKWEVSTRVTLDAAHLPYNRSVVAYLREQKAENRLIYLTTGADYQLAARIAEHLGFFDGVLASEGAINLIGTSKLESLRNRFGDEGYDYIGNEHVDLPLLQHAGIAMIANPTRSLDSRLRSKGVTVEREFEDRAGLMRAVLKALRPHQWAKNILILVPLLLAHTLRPRLVADAGLAFLCFCLCASSTYIVNDLLDIEADRRHPRKQLRPFAAGDLSAQTGALICVLCCGLAFAGANFLLPDAFLKWLLLYFVGTLLYSLYLKRVVLVDVILLSGLYTVRVLAGGGATHVVISPWLSAFSVFLFLSLAMLKRFSELQNVLRRQDKPANDRGYVSADLEQLRSFGTASAYASVVVFSLYISGRQVTTLYRHPSRLWLIVPMILWWLSRVWLLASRGELNEDPVIFAVADRISLLIGAIVALIATLAAF